MKVHTHIHIHTTPSHVDSSAAGEVAETLLCGSDQLTEQPFEPTFIRPLPPLHSCEGEVRLMSKQPFTLRTLVYLLISGGLVEPH